MKEDGVENKGISTAGTSYTINLWPNYPFNKSFSCDEVLFVPVMGATPMSRLSWSAYACYAIYIDMYSLYRSLQNKKTRPASTVVY